MSLSKNLLKYKPNNKTIFTTNEVGQILNIENNQNLYSAINFAVKKGDLYRITRGFYSLDKKYSEMELGNKLRIPSYLSLYTVLQLNGVVFQYYSSIYFVSRKTTTVNINGQKYIYRKVKDNILLNTLGLVEDDFVTKATNERALCDKLYLDGDEYFDNLRNVNWNLMKELNSEIYKSKTIDLFISKNKDASTRS